MFLLGSVCKALALQARGLGFEIQNLKKKAGLTWLHAFAISTPEEE